MSDKLATKEENEVVSIPKETFVLLQIERANLIAENIDLKQKLQNEKEEYTKDLKARVKMYEKVQKTVEDLQTENKQLKQENQELREKLAKLEKDFDDLRKDYKDLKGRFGKIERRMREDRNRLLLGSIAYNFMDCAIEYVFEKKNLRAQRKVLHSISDIGSANKTEEEKGRFDEFVNLYLAEELDDVLQEFTGSERIKQAHPTTLDEDDDEVPKSIDLQNIIKAIYKKNKDIREDGIRLVDFLDKISRILKRARPWIDLNFD